METSSDTNILKFSKATFVYLAEALQYILDNGLFTVYNDDNPIDLLDYLPLLKHGYSLEVTMIYLLQIYILIHNLTDDYDVFIFDNILIQAFHRDIPAAFYYKSYRDYQHGTKIPMMTAVEHGLITEPLNTIEVLDVLGLHYSNMKTLGDLCKINYYTKDDDNELLIYVEDNDLMRDLYKERILAKQLYNTLLYVKVFEQGNLLIIAAKLNDSDVLKVLIQDYRIDPSVNNNEALLHVINNENEEIVKIFLNRIEVDPRINNNEAYRVALQNKNPRIISMVRNAIVERNLYEKQVYEIGFTPLEGVSELPEVMHSYTRSLFR